MEQKVQEPEIADEGEDEETAEKRRAEIRNAEIEADVQSLRLRAKARILRETMGAEAYQKYVVEVNLTIRKAAEQLREAGDRRRQKLRVHSSKSGVVRDSSAAHNFALIAVERDLRKEAAAVCRSNKLDNINFRRRMEVLNERRRGSK